MEARAGALAARPGQCDEEGDEEGTVPPRYQIRIAGHLDETAVGVFAHLNVTYRGGDTLATGELDQAGLHGVLERIRALGLDLVAVRRVRNPVWPGRDPA